ncbi:hypothetical protein Dda_8011 [Drechslerella dactyloides]|uniref:Cns1/TTC4 wheel domain-containing protein n=1 Tax=Drechslerella dactyloides TaxID=74499 RepID=A0AAD6NF48_DREDA|nr:hypothetical protein Dda_8011 [Drechslerella dactyloides]
MSTAPSPAGAQDASFTTNSDKLLYGPAPPTASSASLEQHEKELFQIPLFMQSLDGVTEEDNTALEALRAMAYEGEPHEVADNFRERGNECYQSKNWKDAVEFYTKALAMKCTVDKINEACYANRAACNLELQNYRRATSDCADALRINPRNVKAWYRSARACLALDKVQEASDCVQRGLDIDPGNTALKNLASQIAHREETLTALGLARQERDRISNAKTVALQKALEIRGIKPRVDPSGAPNLPEDATVSLQDSLDPSSTLHYPVLILYPLHFESDFIKSLPEDAKLHPQLAEIISVSNPPPWDTNREYKYPDIEVIVERKKSEIHAKSTLSRIGREIAIKRYQHQD